MREARDGTGVGGQQDIQAGPIGRDRDGERRQPLFALYRVAAARMAPANEAVWRFQDGLRCREAHVAARFANRNTREGASC